ncbi:hypothetical protein ABK040_014659 [Willaertia magna]
MKTSEMKNNENQQQQQNNNEINNLMIPLCNVCIEDEWEQQSICFCKDCSKYLCEIHTGIHKKKFKNHILEYLSPTTTIITTETTNSNLSTTVSSNNNTLQQQLQPQLQQSINVSSFIDNNNTLQQELIYHPSHHYCKEHQDQITNIKCNNCKLLICIKCALQNHKQHDTILIEDCIKKDKEEFIKLFNKKKDSTEIIKKRKLKVENNLLKVNKQIKISNENIELEFDKINKNLNDKKDQLLNEINSLQKNEINKLQNEIKILEENLQQLNEFSQINDLNNLHEIDLNIIKNKIENSKTILNKLFLQNEYDNYNKFNFTINTKKAISLINETKIEESNLTKFSNKFKFVGQFGSKGNGNNQFNYPRDILIDNNLIYIVDTDNNRISIFDINYQFVKQFTLKFTPSCITMDKTNDTLLIGDFWYNIVYRYSKNGILLNKYLIDDNIKKSVFISILGIDIDENENILIYNYNNKKLLILTKNFKLIKEINLDKYCYSILINIKKNELIISNDHNLNIYTKDGKLIKTIESNEKFNCPSKIIYNIVNKQYIICDEWNHRILLFNDNFEFIKSFGKEGNEQNEFKFPKSIAINYKTGHLLVVDKNNHCIKIYK